jgi:hypothetical protein
MKAYAVDVDTFRIAEEDDYSPSWPNRLITTIIIIIISLSCTP